MNRGSFVIFPFIWSEFLSSFVTYNAIFQGFWLSLFKFVDFQYVGLPFK